MTCRYLATRIKICMVSTKVLICSGNLENKENVHQHEFKLIFFQLIQKYPCFGVFSTYTFCAIHICFFLRYALNLWANFVLKETRGLNLNSDN